MLYRTPGVYVEEIPSLPPSIVGVETAIPVFIGYTEKATGSRQETLHRVPHKIKSLKEYDDFFGHAEPEINTEVTLNMTGAALDSLSVNLGTTSLYKMRYALEHYFVNGGGPCYIISVDEYGPAGVVANALEAGLTICGTVDEITLILFPDLQSIDEINFYDLYKKALDQCVSLGDRFVIMDVWKDISLNDPPNLAIDMASLRTGAGGVLGATEDVLKYGAVYYPNLETSLDYYYGADSVRDANVQITGAPALNGTLGELKSKNNAYYFRVLQALEQQPLEMSPAPSVAGVYARVDKSRGVWKAPANENINSVNRPMIRITDLDQEELNVDAVAGKSINAIRTFTGRGSAYIWGSRTLAGNSNEWRYVPVRRFFNFAEESIKKATVQFVFEPNDINTWIRVKSMIEIFLTAQWKAGALQGVTPEQAYKVKVGLGETMTEVDIWEGRMIVEIAMAVVRPAEFIILRFSHKMLSE